ncbi:hypothetical protein A3709_20765 [Halioglobus sp. HI00S01]|uniref:hypothetical protein n=1 Tax=Halioglobus sp. HI00S01 TaxID=1822214 RepID=UPI0007C3BAE9|nr:hypothetical protein [Halioglobus sp. HI00S01]KZX58047.1 hypothetical protein A3709_20765 [Halioglobus sp. HI00S01]
MARGFTLDDKIYRAFYLLMEAFSGDGIADGSPCRTESDAHSESLASKWQELEELVGRDVTNQEVREWADQALLDKIDIYAAEGGCDS